MIHSKLHEPTFKDLNSRVDARVVANVDGRTYGLTYGCTDVKPGPYIAPCLRQAGQKLWKKKYGRPHSGRASSSREGK